MTGEKEFRRQFCRLVWVNFLRIIADKDILFIKNKKNRRLIVLSKEGISGD